MSTAIEPTAPASLVFLRPRGRPPKDLEAVSAERALALRESLRAKAREKYLRSYERQIQYQKEYYSQNKEAVNIRQKLNYHKGRYILTKNPKNLAQIRVFEDRLRELDTEKQLKITEKFISSRSNRYGDVEDQDNGAAQVGAAARVAVEPSTVPLEDQDNGAADGTGSIVSFPAGKEGAAAKSGAGAPHSGRKAPTKSDARPRPV